MCLTLEVARRDPGGIGSARTGGAGRRRLSAGRPTCPRGNLLDLRKLFCFRFSWRKRLHCLQVAGPRPGPCAWSPGVAGGWPAGNRTAVFIGAQQPHPWGHRPQASPQHFPRRPSDGRARGQCLFPSLLSGLSAPSSDLCRGHDTPEQGGRSGKSRGSEGEVTQGGSPGVPAVFSWRRPGTAAWPWISPHYGPSLTPSDFREGWGLRGHSGCPWPGRARRGRDEAGPAETDLGKAGVVWRPARSGEAGGDHGWEGVGEARSWGAGLLRGTSKVGVTLGHQHSREVNRAPPPLTL